jgi:phosphohistidine swiveling domain-containing protein
MKKIFDSKEFIRKIQSSGAFERHVEFNKTPVIIFEPMMEACVNNPYRNILDLGQSSETIVISHSFFEEWNHREISKSISDLEDIKMIEREFFKLMEKYAKEFGDVSIELETNRSLARLINRTKNMTRETYYLFDLFIDELFSTENQEKVKDLQKLRLDADVFVTRYVWGTYEKILDRIKENFGVEEDLLVHATTDEILNFVSDPLKNPLKSEGRDVIGVVSIEDRLVFLEGEAAKEVKNFLEKQNPIRDKLERARDLGYFSGMIGNTGYFKGKVVKLDAKDYDSEKEWKKLEKKRDYVLVTPMTRPELVLYMEKAGAFVTDEGGATCHAAIIAREMGKSCIVGTGIATRFLKDGDLVEVDANKGIVKILDE